MARKRRLQSDSEGEEDTQETQEESPQAKKKRVSSEKEADYEETMEEEDLDCSQAPDFTVSSTVS